MSGQEKEFQLIRGGKNQNLLVIFLNLVILFI
jgi:hypothetical protein